MKRNVGKVKQVQWRDSQMYLTQCNKDDTFKIATIISVGYVVSEDKKKIVLTGDIVNEKGEIRRVITIPRENVISQSLLK